VGTRYPRVGKKEVDWEVLRAELQAQAREMRAARKGASTPSLEEAPNIFANTGTDCAASPTHASVEAPNAAVSHGPAHATSRASSPQGTAVEMEV